MRAPWRGVAVGRLSAAPSCAERPFGFDVLACPRCGQAMRLIALIDQADVVRRILHHLGLPTEVPEPAPDCAPPCLYGTGDSDWGDDEVTFDPAS